MNADDVKQELIEACRLTGKFKTRAGATVNTYFDKYQFEGNPRLLHDLASELEKLIPNDVELLAGLEMGGIPIATALSLKSGIPACFVRKKAKPHGTQTVSEGPSPNGKKTLIVEDVTSTGGQILLSANDLKKSGAEIIGVLLVIARAEKAISALEEAQIPLYAFMNPQYIEKYL